MAASDGSFYDALETRDGEVRERDLFAALPAVIAEAKAKSPAFAALLADVEPAAVTDRESLAALPVMRKPEVIDRQRRSLPFGELTTVPPGHFAHIFAAPGPYYVPQPDRPDPWRFARAIHAAGFRTGDLVHNTLSYHFSPGAWIFDAAARAVGCTVFPGGIGQTELQVRTMAELRPRCYAGTPSFLKILLEKSREIGADISSIEKAVVSAEPFPPSLQAEIRDHGIDAYECYGSAELGLVSYQSAAREGMILDEHIILEIVRPGTGEPVPEGQVGEIVVTCLASELPLIRFSPGDMTAIMPGTSPCGRTNQRIRGWMGRADQSTKVRGLFVHPRQVADVLARHPEIAKARLVVDRANDVDAMVLQCESAQGGEALAAAVAESIQAMCKVRGTASFFAPGSLPNDGKVIDDIRKFD